MAKVLTTEARVANFVIDDLRRRRIPVDGLLKQVGLRRTDLANPEYRLPHVLVLRLIERAASLVGDASYGLRLGASGPSGVGRLAQRYVARGQGERAEPRDRPQPFGGELVE